MTSLLPEKLRLRHFQYGVAAFLGIALLLLQTQPVSGADLQTNNRQMQVEVVAPYVSPTNGLGSWIWEEVTTNDQTCQLWNSFEIPRGSEITKAQLVMTADNEFTLYLDGRELGRGVEWRELYVYDLTSLLAPGRHVLAVKCYNGAFAAGMLFGLRVDLADGQKVEVKSDNSWRIVPEGTSRWEKRTEAGNDWPAAIVIAPLGSKPWWTEPDAIIIVPSLKPVKIYFWQQEWFQFTLLVVCGLVILISLRLMAQLALHRKERYLLRSERARIARDIHDDIGARMTQLVLHGEVAQNELPADSEMRQQLIWICEEARGLLSTMDEILWAVNPQRDTLRDFAAYVSKYAQEFLKPTQIQCLLEVDPEMSEVVFDLPLRRSLLMAIKEALNNAVKHSAATELRLKIHWQDDQLVVMVQDNGKGFDAQLTKPERNGLTNMAQRMQELGGHYRIVSRPGGGCRVEFGMPLKHSSGWAWVWNAKKFPGHMIETRNNRTSESPQNHDPTKF